MDCEESRESYFLMDWPSRVKVADQRSQETTRHGEVRSNVLRSFSDPRNVTVYQLHRRWIISREPLASKLKVWSDERAES
jgi:hypothetical protein